MDSSLYRFRNTSKEEGRIMEMKKKRSLDRLIRREIESGRLPGFLMAVKTESKEETFSYGLADPATGMKMERDTIFRLYSMSKPVCAVAVWILIERGLLSPDDRLEDILDEFRDMTVYTDNGPEPAQNSVRIRDLLNMTAGFTYDDNDTAGQKTGEIFAEIHRAEDEGRGISTREVAGMIARQPLAFEPGRRWRYGLCADVLGAVIEAVDGRRLSDFYREEIFEPLGMKDTGFYVPEEKLKRFAPLFARKETDGKCILAYDREHHLGLDDFLSPPAFESAGAGLVSTPDDYMKFAWMLAGGGKGNGRRILRETTVEQFGQNQLTVHQTKSVYFEHLQGYGYGNLMRVCMDEKEAAVPGIQHSFGWDGWCGPYMMADAVNRRAIIFFLQISAYADWTLNSEILRLVI